MSNRWLYGGTHIGSFVDDSSEDSFLIATPCKWEVALGSHVVSEVRAGVFLVSSSQNTAVVASDLHVCSQNYWHRT